MNLSIEHYAKQNNNKHISDLKEWISKNHPDDILIPFSGKLETELLDLESDQERNEYLSELQQTYKTEKPLVSALPEIISNGYRSLDLIYYFTGGPDEVKAWTIRKHTKAPQAAGI